MADKSEPESLLVSIHAPARGATQTKHITMLNRSFNSRAREGRDYRFCLIASYSSGFNSRAREGRDKCAVV